MFRYPKIGDNVISKLFTKLNWSYTFGSNTDAKFVLRTHSMSDTINLKVLNILCETCNRQYSNKKRYSVHKIAAFQNFPSLTHQNACLGIHSTGKQRNMGLTTKTRTKLLSLAQQNKSIAFLLSPMLGG